jgi:hypothetical protein
VAEISSIELACSVVPPASAWLPEAICAAAAATCSAPPATCDSSASSWVTAVLTATWSVAWSPWYWPVMRAVRSRSATRCMTAVASVNGACRASSVPLKPASRVRYAPSKRSACPRSPSRPASAASVSARVSSTSPRTVPCIAPNAAIVACTSSMIASTPRASAPSSSCSVMPSGLVSGSTLALRSPCAMASSAVRRLVTHTDCSCCARSARRRMVRARRPESTSAMPTPAQRLTITAPTIRRRVVA